MVAVRPDARIRGDYRPKPVEVKLVEDQGSYAHIVGSDPSEKPDIY